MSPLKLATNLFDLVGKKLIRILCRLSRLPLLRSLVMPLLRRKRPFGSRLSQGDELLPSLGTPIVRAYWHHFLEKHRADIRGLGLEIGTTKTLRRFAGDLDEAHALDLIAHSSEVKITADLMRAEAVEGERYDCFINQFTTHILHDLPSALYHSVRLLKPGGILLINFICVTAITYQGVNMGTGGLQNHHWFFTPLHVQHLFEQIGLSRSDFSITSYGSAFAKVAWTMNLPAEFLSHRELHQHDPMQPVLLCVRVRRPSDWSPPCPAPSDAWSTEVQIERP